MSALERSPSVPLSGLWGSFPHDAITRPDCCGFFEKDPEILSEEGDHQDGVMATDFSTPVECAEDGNTETSSQSSLVMNSESSLDIEQLQRKVSALFSRGSQEVLHSYHEGSELPPSPPKQVTQEVRRKLTWQEEQLCLENLSRTLNPNFASDF